MAVVDAPHNESAASSSWAADFDASQLRLQKAALASTRLSNALPGHDDMAFQRTLDRKFAKDVDVISKRVFSMTNQLLMFARGPAQGKGKGKDILADEEDLLEGFHTNIVDIMDQLFEAADKSLDEFTGRLKPLPTTSSISKEVSTKKKIATGRLDSFLLHASTIPKPQLLFTRPVNNDNISIPLPALSLKHHALVPLGHVPDEAMDVDEETEGPIIPLSHPYRHEIMHIDYPTRMFNVAEPRIIKSFEDTPFTWVSTVAELDAMLAKLRGALEIAVDLEHHNYRSYYGFACLMQVSTSEEDWVVDTIALRGELEVLNEVFTNPSIVKVFHGAESDIIWLQENFNLYVVNLFDTFHASRALGGFPRHSLASLLEHFCNFMADKRYQLADWRIRPLPEEMLYYARSDTHYLLFVYDCLRNLLVEGADGAPDLVRQVLTASEQTAGRVFERELYDEETGLGPNGWDIFAKKYGKKPIGAVKSVLLAVHSWRDRVAREEDESLRYTLPNHFILNLADRPPKDIPTLFAIVTPTPVIVRRRSQELLDVITAAVAAAEQVQVTPPPASAELQIAVDKNDVSTTSNAKDSDIELPDIWVSVNAIAPVASTSSLFGTSIPTPAPRLSIASSSSLFGSSLPTPDPRDALAIRYKEIVDKIHGTLVLAPAPSVPQVLDAEALVPEVDTIPGEALEMPAEVAFVPLSEREPKPRANPNADDTIVVVGQARAKRGKRKRAITGVDDDRAEGSSAEHTPVPATKSGKKAKKDDAEEAEETPVQEEFDYATVPNILDDDELVEGPGARGGPSIKKSKKQKKADKSGKGKDKEKKAPVIEYGNFPAPPRNRAEPRSGNVSHSFK